MFATTDATTKLRFENQTIMTKVPGRTSKAKPQSFRVTMASVMQSGAVTMYGVMEDDRTYKITVGPKDPAIPEEIRGLIQRALAIMEAAEKQIKELT